MMLQSCYAVFATSILNSVSFHCFLAPVELEKELLYAAWNQVPWPCKGKSKTTTGYIAGFSINQPKKKNTLKIYTFLHSKNRSRFPSYKQSLFILMLGYKTEEDAFDCDRPRIETFRLVSGF